MRIITRGDFDGLASTVLLTEVTEIREVKLVHPKDAQDGKVPADKEAITAKASVELTLRGVSKTTEVTLNARRSSANIEVQGTIPVTWGDYSIPSPSGGPVTHRAHARPCRRASSR